MRLRGGAPKGDFRGWLPKRLSAAVTVTVVGRHFLAGTNHFEGHWVGRAGRHQRKGGGW